MLPDLPPFLPPTSQRLPPLAFSVQTDSLRRHQAVCFSEHVVLDLLLQDSHLMLRCFLKQSIDFLFSLNHILSDVYD